MSVLKKLAGDTLIYGLSSIIGRMLYFLLMPLHTTMLDKREFGNVTEIYSYTAFLIVIFTYRFETAFFRFGVNENKHKTYDTALMSIVGTTLIFGTLLLFFSPQIATSIGFKAKPEYISFIAITLSLDALAEIPMARLRLENRAKRFVVIRLFNIGINVLANLYFLWWVPNHGEPPSWFTPKFGVGYILISNILASFSTLILLLPEYRKCKFLFDWETWKTMFDYSWPLIVVGMAGIINETFDRSIFKWVSPFGLAKNEALLGEYGAAYKLTMILTLFTQAYRMGAEPFFFKSKNDENAPKIYALATKYFALVASIGMLATLLYLDLLKRILIHPKLWQGIGVVPILLLANLCLGLYYNVSIWYRIKDKTKIGLYISLIGAATTIFFNYYWIPKIGYMGCAWATFLCYAVMLILCYRVGQKYYKISYPVANIIWYISLAFGFYLFSLILPPLRLLPKLFIHSCLFLIYLGVLYVVEKDNWKKDFKQVI